MAGGVAPGWLAVRCLKAFQASRPRIAMVMGDIPPLDSELGVLGPRGPCCMPLMTSSKPIGASSCPATKKISAGHDGYKAPALFGPRNGYHGHRAGMIPDQAKCLWGRH